MRTINMTKSEGVLGRFHRPLEERTMSFDEKQAAAPKMMTRDNMAWYSVQDVQG
jgi:hypothetical protein